MEPRWVAVATAVVFFLAVIPILEIGYRIGRASTKASDLAQEGTGDIEAAVFGLVGLLLALTFAGGMDRLQRRRDIIVDEANAIGTAYLRIDVLPAKDQPEMRRLFRDYLDSRLSFYEHQSDRNAALRELDYMDELQHRIWSLANTSLHDDPTQNVARLLLPALNQMIDISTTHTIALQSHLPSLVYALLVLTTLLSGMLAGYSMAQRKRRSWLHICIYAAVSTMTLYVVLDLEYPRSGLITLRSADAAIEKLRETIR